MLADRAQHRRRSDSQRFRLKELTVETFRSFCMLSSIILARVYSFQLISRIRLIKTKKVGMFPLTQRVID